MEEMTTKDNGGPAFPTTPQNYDDMDPAGAGMTLRDYFAAKALSGLLAGLDRDARRFMEREAEPAAAMAKACYTMADAMLKARKK
jgi:hypothetical protein